MIARSIARELYGALSWRGGNPVQLAYDPRGPAGDSDQITASAFNRLIQYASCPGNRAYCYAELAVSSLAVAEIIASTHCAYPRRNGPAK